MESQGLTKPCVDEEPRDTLGIIVLLALEDLTSHGFLMQLRSQGRGGASEGGAHHGGRWACPLQKLSQPPSPSVCSQHQEAEPCHQYSQQRLLYLAPGSTNQGRGFPGRVMTAFLGSRLNFRDSSPHIKPYSPQGSASTWDPEAG